MFGLVAALGACFRPAGGNALPRLPSKVFHHGLAENLGFSPVQLGRLSEGGLLVHARGNSWGRLIFKDLVTFAG
jgi:hypothetical protein